MHEDRIQNYDTEIHEEYLIHPFLVYEYDVVQKTSTRCRTRSRIACVVVARASVKLLSWAYVRQGVYFWAYGTPGVSIFGVFVRQAFRFSV